MSLKFCLIGAGNLATHLADALQSSAGNVIQVYSRTEQSAVQLAEKLNTQHTTSVSLITTEADIYFIALKDSALTEVLSGISLQDKILVHCSGSLPLSVLKQFSENIGVLYPLQTFSKDRNIEFKNIPVFIEAEKPGVERLLLDLAQKISDKVSILDSENRRSLHIAAVFACNFVNHFYSLSAEFLNSKGIPFHVLHPLILETASKATEMDPLKAQTGPAVRFDRQIIDAHLEALQHFPQLQSLYNSISRSIFEQHQRK